VLFFDRIKQRLAIVEKLHFGVELGVVACCVFMGCNVEKTVDLK
jgi:hypothetical protein